MMHDVRSLALALATAATPALAEMNPTLERALQACLSQDMSAEARFAQLETDGWQFLRDTPQAREFIVLQRIFFQRAWGLVSDWRKDADKVKAYFAKQMAEPLKDVEYQTEKYGDQFTAATMLAEVKYLAAASLEHPDVAGVLNAALTLPNDSAPEFGCNFDLAEMPDPDTVAALLPATAERKDSAKLPGMFAAKSVAEGEAQLDVYYSPLTGRPDYDEMLNILGAKYSYDGMITTIVKPVEVRQP
jgi:hypothetical protein